MLFYTSITTNQLPLANKLSAAIKTRDPNTKFYTVLCDQLPTKVQVDISNFDGIIYSSDLILDEKVSTAYWHFLHTPDALCSAAKSLAVPTLLKNNSEDTLVYVSPHLSTLPNFSELEALLEEYPILVAPHSMFSKTDRDPRESVFSPNFFAVKNCKHGALFLNYWNTTAKTLWQTQSPIDSFSYNRLLDTIPALYDNYYILRTTPTDSILTDGGDYSSNIVCSYPCIYESYDNGEKITLTDRNHARTDCLLRDKFGNSNPYQTQSIDNLYHTLRDNKDSNIANDSLYWNEYQEILNSTSYRLGKKIVDFTGKILPTKLFNKLRGVTVQPIDSNSPSIKKKELDIVPLSIPDNNTPLFSVIILDCKSFDLSYQCIHSLISANSDVDFEVLLAGTMSPESKEHLLQIVSGIAIVETTDLSKLLQEAKGHYALLLYENTLTPENFLRTAVNQMESHQASIAQCKVIFSNGTIYEAGGVMTQSGQRLSYGYGLKKDLGCVSYVKEIDCPSMNGTIIDLTAAASVGFADADFSPIYQLADLSFRLRKENQKTLFLPQLELTDYRAPSETFKPFASVHDAFPFALKWKKTLERENITDSSQMFYGRDRSKGKLTIFAVDDRIPCYDLSAGDRNTYQYYETMSDMGYNLKIVGNDYIRQEPYATKLEQQGIEIVAADGRGEIEYREFLRDYGKFIDCAYLNRPGNLAKYTPEVKKYNPNVRIIYCCHDLHFLRELREHEVNGNKKEAERVRNYAKEEISRMDLADVIFDVSAYEKSILDSQLKHAKVEVNPIFIYREFPEFKENFDQRNDLLFVGSFKHPANLDGVNWLCKEIFPIVIKAIPEIKLHLVGAHPTPEIKALANDHIIVHGFLSDEDLAEMYRNCRLSVVPLRFGAGVKGKVLEAMYHGLPIVSTSIGTEGIIDIEKCIENTDGSKEFAKKIIELYSQTDKLTEMGRINWQYVQDHLGIEPAKELFRRSFESI